MRNVLGTFLLAVAALGLHPLCLADETVVSWELHAFVDVDGVRKLDKKILKTPFTTLNGCVQYALQLPHPEPAYESNGHIFVPGYECLRVEVPAVST